MKTNGGFLVTKIKQLGDRIFEKILSVAGDLSPQRIIEQLSIYNGKMIIPEETLIIFDEVQE